MTAHACVRIQSVADASIQEGSFMISALLMQMLQWHFGPSDTARHACLMQGCTSYVLQRANLLATLFASAYGNKGAKDRSYRQARVVRIGLRCGLIAHRLGCFAFVIAHRQHGCVRYQHVCKCRAWLQDV